MVQGFCFALLQCSPYKRLQRVLFCSCSYTAHTAKRHTWLYRGFSCDLPHHTVTDTRPTQTAIMLPVPRWSVSQRRSTSSAYQIPPPRPDAAQASVAAYYNNVYKRADHASGGGSAPTVHGSLASADTLSAVQTRRLAVWHRVSSQGAPGQSGGGSPAAEERRAARNH